MDDRGHLQTERCNPHSSSLDLMSIGDAFDLMNREDASIAAAVAAARQEISQAIELVVAAFRGEGRLLYVGAGTSGRLGVLDAAECPPTFQSDPQMVRGIIAGGVSALTVSVEGAEDQAQAGAAAVEDHGVGPRDVVFGITTGGTTPYVHGALSCAKRRGAKTVFLACVSKDEVPDDADVSIRVVTGPEVVTGSTRLKAGTATKMVLNCVTTIAMVQIGKTYGNLMVDMNTTANRKLVDRGIRVLQSQTGLPRTQAAELLREARGHVKSALVMHWRGVDYATGRDLLDQAGGRVANVVDRQAFPNGSKDDGCADDSGRKQD